MKTPRQHLSPRYAATILRVTPQTIRNYISAGILPASRPHPSGQYVISVSDFAEFCNECDFSIDPSLLIDDINTLRYLLHSCPIACSPNTEFPSWLKAGSSAETHPPTQT